MKRLSGIKCDITTGLIGILLISFILQGCSSVRHVPEGSLLLDDVRITVDSNVTVDGIEPRMLTPYLRQLPNHKTLWSMKMRLGVYNLSGNDSTKFWNRWVRKLGEPPVIYDPTLTDAGTDQLRKLLVNKGYLDADVVADTMVSGKKIKIDYRLRPGERHTISSIDYDLPNDTIREMIMKWSDRFPVRVGGALDRTLLETQREMITTGMRNSGFYEFTKDCITFNADTTAGSLEVDLTMRVDTSPGNRDGKDPYRHYMLRKVVCITDYDPVFDSGLASYPSPVTNEYKGIEIKSSTRPYLRPQVIYENSYLLPGREFRERDIDRTYSAFSRLRILKFISIKLEPAGTLGDTGLLDAYIMLTPEKSQSFSVELEGTNSEGDLGVAVGLTYTHRNIGKGSESLTAKVRGSYEALSGSLKDLINNRYQEYSSEVALSFPKFKAPLLSERLKRRVNASTELNVSFNYQERPEYTRMIWTTGWSYTWNLRNREIRHKFTPLDINYVYLPRSSYNFLDILAPDNPLLRYSYEDHFIMRLGYSFYYSSRRAGDPLSKRNLRDFFTIRANGEFAGNLLFAISSIFGHRRDFKENPYSVFNIRYSQYFRAEGDASFVHFIDDRNSLAFHAGLGIGVPYGNSTILPFEKRFYGGGANGVRGWEVRTLGPGSYPGVNSVSDFINQCGDIRLEFNAEYRAKLIWIIELGAFVDIGNIWTIRNYENQPGGVFRFNRFYEQLAAAYGLGFRLDFNYFLLRFDIGMKAHNPASGEYHWPLVKPRWKRDSSFHFSIGYPF